MPLPAPVSTTRPERWGSSSCRCSPTSRSINRLSRSKKRARMGWRTGFAFGVRGSRTGLSLARDGLELDERAGLLAGRDQPTRKSRCRPLRARRLPDAPARHLAAQAKALADPTRLTPAAALAEG